MLVLLQILNMAQLAGYLTCQQVTNSNLVEFLVQTAEEYTIPGGIPAADQRLKMVN